MKNQYRSKFYKSFSLLCAAIVVSLAFFQFGETAGSQSTDSGTSKSLVRAASRGELAKGSPEVPYGPAPGAAWMNGANMPQAKVRYGFATAGQTFYIISGVNSSFFFSNTVHSYNAVTDAWTTLANIPFAREAPMAAEWNGKIYVCGGTSGAGGTTNLQIYDIATNTWSAGPPMPDARWGGAAASNSGKIYVAGGLNATDNSVATVMVFDIATNSWSFGPPAPLDFELGGYVKEKAYLFLVGGYDSGTTNSNATLRFDMNAGTWSTGPAFTERRADFALAARNEKLYAIGGDENGGGFFDESTAVSMLDATMWPGGSWMTSPDALPSPRSGNMAGFASNARTGGEIWTTGGGNGSTVLNAHIYRSTVVATPTPTPIPSPTPTVAPSPTPTVAPSPTPTVAPSPTPTVAPSPTPTVAPSPTPTVAPSPTPTVAPSPTPTGTRNIRVVNAAGNPGGTVTVPIVIDALGNETSTSFTVVRANTAGQAPEAMDVLTNPVVAIGSGVPAGSNLGTNLNQAPERVGILVDSTNTYAAGTREIVRITYNIPANAPLGLYAITFSSTPTVQSVSNASGALLPTNYVAGFVQVGATAAGVEVSGRVLTPDGRGIRNAVVVMTDSTGTLRYATTGSFGHYTFADVEAGSAIILGVQSKRFRFAPRLLSITDSVDNIDFVALE